MTITPLFPFLVGCALAAQQRTRSPAAPEPLRGKRATYGLFTLMVMASHMLAQETKPSFRFDFGPGAAAPGYVAVRADTHYSRERGYGFEPGAMLQDVDRGGDALTGDFVTGDKLFKFSVAVPEGNYRVTVTLGDAQAAATTTVKAENRRLVVERLQTAAGKFATRTFAVNVRTPAMPPEDFKLPLEPAPPRPAGRGRGPTASPAPAPNASPVPATAPGN
ncbi:MAG: hypothetical protein HY736_21165 [Verrucomicrobia bacterium]|nr:hypothetical protein [Verrucomicrobiota bacterium]